MSTSKSSKSASAPARGAKKDETARSAPDTVAPKEDVMEAQPPVIVVHHDDADTVVSATVDAATQTVEKAVTVTQAHVESVAHAGTVAFKSYEDILQFGKDNVEALVQSNAIVARGLQDLSHSVATLVQASIAESVAASKSLFGAKSLKEVLDLSSTLAQANIGKLVSESSKISQASAKLAEAALAPLSSRVDAVVEKMTKTAA